VGGSPALRRESLASPLPLTMPAPKSLCLPCQSAGRPLSPASLCGDTTGDRGKSGLHGPTVAANGRRGRPQGKCHRNQTANGCFGSMARVKWCGKSAPRLWQQRWQGKPHREQDQIGAAGRAGNRGAESGSRPLPGLVARGDVRASPQMNGRRGGQPPDKTRLTGRLTFSFLRHACAATQLPAAVCLSRLSPRNRITRYKNKAASQEARRAASGERGQTRGRKRCR
jgi:hypothetical protein